MSFILDALRKSENERQQQADAEFATVPSGSPSSPAPRWLWVLGALLLINVVVLLGLLLRPDTPPITNAVTPATAPAAIETPEPDAEVTAEPAANFESQVADARRTRPAPTAAPETDVDDIGAAEPADGSATIPAPATDGQFAALPTLTELLLDGRISLPELHIDIHAYSDAPAERFVFINMNKYGEGERLSEGPRLREITRDGVVLDHQGTAFILLRE